MTVHRTTATPRPLPRWTITLLLCLGACVFAGATRAQGDGNDLDLQLIERSPHAPQLPPQLQIATTWPTSCAPVLDHASVTATGIDVVVRDAGRPCVKAATPVRWVIDTPDVTQTDGFPQRVHPLRLSVKRADQSTRLLAFGLLDANSPADSVEPDSGFWWSVDAGMGASVLPGSGITIERQGENLAISLLGYRAGQPTWYFGSTTARGSVARVHLVRLLGGSEPFAGAAGERTAESGPVLNLHFQSPGQAKAWLERPAEAADDGIELQEIDLMHLVFSAGSPASVWRGRWVLVTAPSIQARVLTLSSARSSDAETFRLVDDAAMLTLDCRTVDVAGHVAPTVCSLHEGGTVIADFDHIGLDAMRGITRDGTRAQLVRLPD